MNTKTIFHIIILLSVICLLTACGTKSEPETIPENSCIPPLDEFAYYAGSGNLYPEESVIPPAPWTMIAPIELRAPILLGARTLTDNVTELWFSEDYPLAGERNTQNQIYIFRTDNKKLTAVTLDEVFMNSSSPVGKIYITKDNLVWTSVRYQSTSKIPILGKYDEINNKLRPVEKLYNVPYHSTYATLVLFDSNNNLFWFFVPYGDIYSYDPVTDTLKKHISTGEKHISGAVIRSDGKIYIYASRYEYTSDGAGDALFLYSPADETLEQVRYYLEKNYQAINLYIDEDKRLWMGSNGWMEPDGTWYQIVKSPLFIRAVGQPDSGDHIFHYFPPNVEFETSDGLLWFTGTGGMRGGTYSLNFENEDWCWVSTSSNTIMDNGGNLWMVVDDKVYKRSE